MFRSSSTNLLPSVDFIENDEAHSVTPLNDQFGSQIWVAPMPESQPDEVTGEFSNGLPPPAFFYTPNKKGPFTSQAKKHLKQPTPVDTTIERAVDSIPPQPHVYIPHKPKPFGVSTTGLDGSTAIGDGGKVLASRPSHSHGFLPSNKKIFPVGSNNDAGDVDGDVEINSISPISYIYRPKRKQTRSDIHDTMSDLSHLIDSSPSKKKRKRRLLAFLLLLALLLLGLLLGIGIPLTNGRSQSNNTTTSDVKSTLPSNITTTSSIRSTSSSSAITSSITVMKTEVTRFVTTPSKDDLNSATLTALNTFMSEGTANKDMITSKSDICDYLDCGDYGVCVQIEINSYTCRCSLADHCETVNTCGSAMDLILVIDTSTSIGEENFSDVLHFFVDVAAQLSTGVRVAVVTFNSVAHKSMNFTSDQHVIKTHVEGIAYNGGGTDISAGILAARQMLMVYSNNTAVKVIILFTDGLIGVELSLQQVTDGQSEEEASREQARLATQEGIGIITIGVGSEINVKLLKELSHTYYNFLYFDGYGDLMVETWNMFANCSSQ